MQEWEDPLRFNLDLRLLQRQGHNQPTDRPTDCVNSKKKKEEEELLPGHLSNTHSPVFLFFLNGDLLSSLSRVSSSLTEALSREENSPVGLRTRR